MSKSSAEQWMQKGGDPAHYAKCAFNLSKTSKFWKHRSAELKLDIMQYYFNNSKGACVHRYGTLSTEDNNKYLNEYVFNPCPFYLHSVYFCS